MGDHAEITVVDWSGLVPKRAYILRSPQGEDRLSTYLGPGEAEGSHTFFAHAPGEDGELTLRPDSGWLVVRGVGDDYEPADVSGERAAAETVAEV